jgi:hypothetical protein
MSQLINAGRPRDRIKRKTRSKFKPEIAKDTKHTFWAEASI